MKWGIVGVGDPNSGSIARRVAVPGILEIGGEISVVLTREKENVIDLSKNCPDLRIFTNMDDFLVGCKYLGVDFIYVGTPPMQHFDQSTAVAKAGFPCIIEKPLALTITDCVKIRSAFKSRNVPMDVAHVLVYHPAYQEIKNQLPELGKIISVTIKMLFPKIKLLKPWYLEVNQGGILRDMITHIMAILYFLFSDVGQFQLYPGKKIIFEREDNDGKAYPVDICSILQGIIRNINVEIDFSWIAEKIENTLTIEGENGEIILDCSDRCWKLSKHLNLNNVTESIFDAQNLFALQFANFVRYTQGDSAAEIYNGEIGLQAVRIFEPFYKGLYKEV